MKTESPPGTDRGTTALVSGARVGAWQVEQVLARGPRGGLYLVSTANGPRILKELRLPPELSREVQEERRSELLAAVKSWQEIGLSSAIPVEELLSTPAAVYLLLPQLEGNNASVVCKLRKENPEAGRVAAWADELATLVQALLDCHHPLAFEVLRADRLLLSGGHQEKLVAFNPGWSEILWDPYRLHSRARAVHSPQAGLNRFGELVIFLATGRSFSGTLPDDLPSGLLWMLSRCVSNVPGRCYEDFAQVRRGLRNLIVQGEEARNLRQLGNLPPVEGFVLPTVEAISRQTRVQLALVASALVFLVALLGLYLWWLEPADSLRPGLALASGREVLLVKPDGITRTLCKFSQPIRCMTASLRGHRLYLGLEDEPALRVVNPESGESLSRVLPDVPDHLQVTPDGGELVAIFSNGRVWRLDLRKDQEKPMDSVDGLKGATSVAFVPLPGVQSQHQHMEGVVVAAPGVGLVLFDGTSGKSLRKWHRGGTETVLSLAEGLVTATLDGRMVLLGKDLKELRTVKMPGGRGGTRLYPCRDGLGYWAVREDGWFSFWRMSDFACAAQGSLAAPASGAAVDELGRLWVMTEDLTLFRVELRPTRVEKVTRMGGSVTDMIYLPPNWEPRGLDRLILNTTPPH